MANTELMTTDDADLFKKLTHSYREELSRILWINRTSTTTAIPTTSATLTTTAAWAWPDGHRSVSVTFPARLTHSYDLSNDLQHLATTTSTASTTTATTLTTSTTITTKGVSYDDSPFIVLPDGPSVLFDDSESTFPSKAEV